MSSSVLNILIKVLAFLLAILLWFYVVSRKDYDYELTLPVTEVDYPDGLGPVSGIPDSLSVKIFAEGQKLLGNGWKRDGLKIKASRLRRGINSLELNLETVSLVRSDDINLVELNGPSLIQVHLDRIDSTFKPIASRLAVIPDDGYAIISGSEKMEPDRTMITGPAYVLGRLDSLHSEQKIIDNAKKPVEIYLPLEIPDSLSIQSAVDSVLISIEVDKIINRKFENFTIEVREIKPDQRVIIDPEKISLEISGPKAVLDSLTDQDLSVWLAPSETNGDVWIAPEVNLPNGVNLKSLQPDSIRVLVEN